MNIMDGIRMADLGLFIEKGKILVLADLHIGQEDAMTREGMLIPRFQHKDLVARTKQILSATSPSIIVLNGDIKHEFASISREEWKQVQSYLDLLLKSSTVIIVKGNHDKILEPIAAKKGIITVNHYCTEDIYICHGDSIHKNDDYEKSKVLIIGHEHPAVALRDGNRVEKYKCFLKGKYKENLISKAKTILVMPSMNDLNEGTDVLVEKLHSPFLKNINTDNFEVWIAETEIFYFGQLKGLKR